MTEEGVFYMEGPGGEEVKSIYHGEDLYGRVLSRLLDKTVFLWKNETIAEFVHAAMKVFFRGCLECPDSVTNLVSMVRWHLGPFSEVILNYTIGDTWYYFYHFQI